MNERPTPEADAAWEFAWDEGGCCESHLLETMQMLERQRDELLESLERISKAAFRLGRGDVKDIGLAVSLMRSNAENAIAIVKGESK
jgi:hypothetical protein